METASVPPENDLDKLHKLLRERAVRVAASVLSQGGSVAREDVQSLKNLADLCATCESTLPKPKSNRWLLAILCVLALSCASILLFRSVTSTTVEINVTASSGEFRLAQERLLTGAAPVNSLRLIGVQRLSQSPCPASVQSSPHDLTIVPGGGRNPGAITIQPIDGTKELSVAVLATDSPNRWELAFARVPVVVRATVEGAAKINDEPCLSASAFPRSLEAVLDERASRVIVEFPNAREQFLPPLLPVDSMSFVRTDFVETQGQQQASSLLSGTIFFEELSGKESKLRDGEWLEIGVHGAGWVRPPRTSGPNLAWRYRGSVDTLKSGPADSQRDLKPSWLEYARAQHGLELLWGTALSLFGLGGTLLRWWKRA
jgi:hypothetical protein